MFGARQYANQYEKNYQVQYAYFAAGNAKIPYKYDSLSTAVWAWLRSPHYDYSLDFVVVTASGAPTIYYASNSGGILAGFAVGSAA